MKNNPAHRTIAVIGAGNMASAIVRGALAADPPPVNAQNWLVVARSDERRELWGDTGVNLRPSVESLHECWDEIGTVLLAVKPQMLGDVSHDARDLDFAGKSMVSILAGSTINQITGSFTGLSRVIRAMPNTPLRVGQGLTAIAAGPGATEQDAALCRSIFSCAGETIDLPENMLDAFTALAGSGPAYLFYLAQAMRDAALEMGFDDAQSTRLVARTLLGSASLLDQSGEDPASLRAAVTSKAGTTHAATSHLDDQSVLKNIRDAVIRARDRGRELSRDA